MERLKGMSLLVRAESDGSLLLESRIQPDTAYQKQQGTLIVWSEGENFDLALSFQEKAGCDEIWEKICQVNGVRLLMGATSLPTSYVILRHVCQSNQLVCTCFWTDGTDKEG